MADLIDRQAAIELCDWYEHEYAEAVYAIRPIGEDLKQLPSAQPERWIPCSERMPEKYKYVLTTYIIQPWRSKKPKRFVHIAEWMGDGWKSPIDEYLVRDEVAKIRYLAWMPLPEPAKLENE